MKTHKSGRLLAYTLIVTIPLWFGSCKKGTDVTPTSASIEGTWRTTGYKADPGVDVGGGKKETDLLVVYRTSLSAIFGAKFGDLFVGCITNTKVTFLSGGKVSSQSDPACAQLDGAAPVTNTSTWKLDGSKLTITDGPDVTTYDAAISGSTLKLSAQEMIDFDGDGKEEKYNTTLELTKQ